MSADRARLNALIESVADGAPVQWDTLEAAAVNESARRRLQHLRLVAAVAAVHRSQVAEDGSFQLGNEPTGPTGPHEGVPRWGHLLLLERIGEGSFGEVYRAYDPWLDREVALKLLKPADPEETPPARILWEAQTLARLRHPNVVQVHGADIHDSRVGLWMELLRGRTLEELVASQGPLGADEAAVVGQEICRALAAVHAAGLVHCDVKATNVMREAGGRLVLMDFGAGQRRDLASTGSPLLAGTPLYLAPEVLAGLGATTRSDIYSVGVLLYRLVTGDYPVNAASLDLLRAAHYHGDRRRLSDARPDLPDSFVHVVERALSPVPEHRFGSAGEMQAALNGLVGSGHSRRGRLASPARRWLMRAAITLAVAVGVLLWFLRDSRAPAAPRTMLVAVLPFQVLSPDPGEAYLASAVPMELSARLARIGAMKVVPWTFMRRFAGDTGTSTLQDVAGRTGADAIVEGAIQRVPAPGSAGAVQVRVQVFASGSGAMLLSASFEREIGDLFVLQAQVAREIATRLRLVPAASEEPLLLRSRQVPSEAMEDYLNGRHQLEVQANLSAAAALFQRAAEKAPAFAEAHIGLAWCYALESAYAGAMPADTALERSLEAANRAIAIDPDIPEAWAARAFARFALEGNWRAAASDFERALLLGPNAVDVLLAYSNYLTDLGRHAEAVATARRAEERAPLSVAATRQVAWALYMARRFDEAVEQARRTLEIEPGYPPARTVLGRALIYSGRADEGLRELEGAGREHEQMLATGYALAGRREQATQLIDRILSPAYDRAVVAYEVAQTYAALGDDETAMDWLETAFVRREAGVTELQVDPLLDPLRETPRFRALLERVGSPR